MMPNEFPMIHPLLIILFRYMLHYGWFVDCFESSFSDLMLSRNIILSLAKGLAFLSTLVEKLSPFVHLFLTLEKTILFCKYGLLPTSVLIYINTFYS